MATTILPLIHWNDVYRVSPQKVSPSSKETIDVTQFGAMLNNIRNRWAQRPDGTRDGLALFSGDVFSPSTESTITRGSHMVPVFNELAPDVSLTGNHDFDFGYPHLSKLIEDTSFPWILSNIIDNTTNKVPHVLQEFVVLERVGVRIGVVGLVEQEWISTVSSWPPNFEWRDMKETGLDLSRRLRDPDGEYKCDLIIALTHSRVPNDIELAKQLLALSPSEQSKSPVHNSHGVDLILGGHDHLYYASKGVSSWDNYDVNEKALGAEDDNGDILVVKSGTDFRDLSEISLELVDSPSGSIRGKVISKITGIRHSTKPGSESSQKLTDLLKTLLSSVSKSLKAPVCKSTVSIDVRSQFIRTEESATCNWFADVVRHAYDDSLCMKGFGGSDAVFLCGGTFRGDSMYGPGHITLGDIMEILPFEDPLVVLELDGPAIWDSLEASLSTWPAQEGRFPVVSGIRVSWDSRKEPGQRVLGVWLTKELDENDDGGGDESKIVDAEAIERTKGGKKYKMLTREYMAQGHDGFLPMKTGKYLIDDENGQMMSTIVRKYLLGSHFVNKMARLADAAPAGLQPSTKSAIQRQQAKVDGTTLTAAQHWKHAASLALNWSRSKAHYQGHINVCTTEHMSSIDPYDGKGIRTGNVRQNSVDDTGDVDLLIVSPKVDGRLKDEGRS